MGYKTQAQAFMQIFEEVSQKKFEELARKNNMYCRKPVIVYSVTQDNKYAKIRFPESPSQHSEVLYTNRTGRRLKSNDKVYLMYTFGNPSQGWLEDNTPL